MCPLAISLAEQYPPYMIRRWQASPRSVVPNFLSSYQVQRDNQEKKEDCVDSAGAKCRRKIFYSNIDIRCWAAASMFALMVHVTGLYGVQVSHVAYPFLNVSSE